MNDGTLIADGLDDAIIGTCYRAGYELAVYDTEKIIKILMDRDGMTEEEALEFFSFNIEGAWVGDGTPIYLCRKEE